MHRFQVYILCIEHGQLHLTRDTNGLAFVLGSMYLETTGLDKTMRSPTAHYGSTTSVCSKTKKK